ncbi:hypothetical protein VTL71DRAFT_9881 [Oculimacula yallundae]|uniref:F-box domain-containing protein n=1 Tax=Oculimacula yallundae TaxID=86028 RepID=A0ABR4BQT4_9HELO
MDCKQTGNLLSLSDELLSMIIWEVSCSDPRFDLSPPMSCLNCQEFNWEPFFSSYLGFVCKRLHHLVLRLQYRSVVLTPLKLKQLQSMSLKLREHVILYTRVLTIVGIGFNWTDLEDLVTDLKVMKCLCWKSWAEAIPLPIHEAIEFRSLKAQLCLENFPVGRWTDDCSVQEHDFSLFQGLLGRSSITSICARVNYEQPSSIRRLLDLAISCPNLGVLELRLVKGERDGLSRDALSSLNHRQGAHDSGVTPEDRLPPVWKLVYERQLVGPWRPQIPATLFDWQNIRHLELRGPEMHTFLKSITGQFASLQTLKLANLTEPHPGLHFYERKNRRISALAAFVQSLCGLVDFEMVNSKLPLPLAVFEHLSAGLQRLCYHGLHSLQPGRVYGVDGSVPQFPLTAQYLQHISNFCANLSCLDIDMLIVDELPLEFLSTLTSFKHLQSLCLRVRTLNAKDPSNYLSRDIKLVTALARYLMDYKKGCSFRRIDFHLMGYVDMGERPELQFWCYKSKDGDLVVEDNGSEIDTSGDRAYMFDGEDIDEWETVMAEADNRMAVVKGEEYLAGGDMESLFGGSSPSDFQGQNE